MCVNSQQKGVFHVEHHKVESSAIVSIGHDPDTGVMEIVYKGGRLYRSTSNVPRATFDKVMAHPSKGNAVNELVKPHHTFEHVPTHEHKK